MLEEKVIAKFLSINVSNSEVKKAKQPKLFFLIYFLNLFLFVLDLSYSQWAP